ncbi:hypothetical protein ACIA5D_23565 [Actinoplanes sp. NPDC051513]|uniref:hypothetical protein n=1 Tax=Actinoplanes sp. NPDC051513 TaxID=3363908 RepID=UPI003796CDBB
MRLRVRFRYNAKTGEVEAFTVDDVDGGPRAADHDARHDAATRDVARVVDPYASIHEVGGPPAVEPPLTLPPDDEEQRRSEPMRD